MAVGPSSATLQRIDRGRQGFRLGRLRLAFRPDPRSVLQRWEPGMERETSAPAKRTTEPHTERCGSGTRNWALADRNRRT